MIRSLLGIFFLALCCQVLSTLISGCAQIGAPTGGLKDTLPPVLVKAVPENNQLNFTGNKIVLNFNEYIEVQDLQNNLLISPFPKNNPSISGNLKTITIKIKDTLQPNTTYNIDFGNAIKDINEGNVMKDFSYVFSTGNNIDSLRLSGKVIMAETGKIDSTLLVLLYRNAPDSAVTSRKPDYVSRVKGDGSFSFKNLPSDEFNVYALKDGDGNKYYNSKTEIFAFSDNSFNTKNNNDILLYAYAEAKQQNSVASGVSKKEKDKSLRYGTNFINGKQDLLQSLELSFKNALKTFNADSILLSDTNFIKVTNANILLDSNRKKIIINTSWKADASYILTIPAETIEDSMGLRFAKNDTIRFMSKANADYGSLKLTFKNIDLSKHPLLQFMEGENIKWKFSVSSNEWFNKMMLPGDYDVRLLYDENNNGQWDPGNYTNKLQPEKAIVIPKKISIKADWENEQDIEL
jgi:hypothetical protein